jgi:hypothetical protein
MFIYYTALYNTVNISSRLPVLAYLQAIVTPIHYLELREKPYTSAHISLGERCIPFTQTL